MFEAATSEEADGGERSPRTVSSSNGPPKRHLRNYLLNPRFQLKYTGAVVLVTAVVAGVLGWYAYRFSTELTESFTMQAVLDGDGEALAAIRAEAEAYDRQVAWSIAGGIVLLVLALGVTGIFVTHRLVGPAYKLKRLIRHVTNGHLEVAGSLRKGDELHDIFEAFEAMIRALRRRQEEEIAQLDRVLEALDAAGDKSAPAGELQRVRDAMAASLERKTLA